jgi:hypothetical protein
MPHAIIDGEQINLSHLAGSLAVLQINRAFDLLPVDMLGWAPNSFEACVNTVSLKIS